MVDYLAEIPLPGRILASPPKTLAIGVASPALPSFVAGPENRLVAATMNRVLTSASSGLLRDANCQPRLLALFGPSGVGKTHLAEGLVRHWQRERGDEAACYTTAADFRRRFHEAIESNRVDEFRNNFRGLQLLAIDDIHRFPDDDYLMQELRCTLDAFEENGGMIIVTSPRPANTLSNLSPDVRSRLASGLSLQLAPPGNAARVRIIRHASAALGRDLSIEATNRLAAGIVGTATQLIGALFDLGITPDSASDTFRTQQLLTARANHQPPIHEIIAVVARYTNVPQKQLKSGSRRQSIVYARSIAVHLARELTAASYDQIGRALGGRDHTTIMHSYKTIKRQLVTDPIAQDAITALRRILSCR